MGRYIAGVLAMLLSGCAAEAAEKKEGPSGELRLSTERVVIFKDGYALLLKHAEAVADARGVVFTEQVPDSAVLGTFWAWSEGGPAMRVMRAEWVEREVEREERGACTDPAALLTANPGKRVTVELEGLSLTGTVLVTPAAAPAVQPAPPRLRLNELEDIRGAAVDLVVGVPNFRFRDVASPLSLEGVVRNTLAQAAPSLMGSQNSMSNAMFSQRSGEWRGGGAEEADSAAPRIPDFGGPGESADFFIHPLAELDLPKGARAVVPLWREEVPTHDLYTLDMKVRRDSDNADTVHYGGTGSGSASPLRLARGEVWHQLELKNGTKYPLTTGPVLAMRGQVPQAQELLTFTPRGGSTLVPLTIAPDVRSLHEEVEVERKQDALKSNRASYALLRKKGTLTLSNPRGEPTPMRIRLSTGGKVEQVSGGGRVKVDDFRTEDWGDSRLASVNSHSDVEWAVTLKPGERLTLTYEVSFWR